MAGSAVPTVIEHRPRGVVRTNVTITPAATGVATAAVVGVGFGRLVGVTISGTDGALIALTDTKSGAAIYTRQLGTAFASTTTGDATGGASEDLFTAGAAHGLSEEDPIIFSSVTGNTVVVPGTVYYITKTTGFAATTFSLSSTAALAAATTVDIELDADISASTWYAVAAATPIYERPTMVIQDQAGTAVSAATSATNVNRDILLSGKVTIGATIASGVCKVGLIVDESGIGDLALTI